VVIVKSLAYCGSVGLEIKKEKYSSLDGVMRHGVTVDYDEWL
jgi:hypothetical protein